jgi:hypothetical protein
MIRVVQRQHDESFLRIAWDPRISVRDSATTDTEARAIFFSHDIGSLAEQYIDGLIKLSQHRVTLFVGGFPEASYISTLLGHTLSGGCFTSYTMVSDPDIIFQFQSRIVDGALGHDGIA